MSKIYVTILIKNYFSNFDKDIVINKYFEKWKEDENSKYYSLIKNNNEQDAKNLIKNIWEFSSNLSKRLGTFFHKMIENYLKSVEASHSKNVLDLTELYKDTDISLIKTFIPHEKHLLKIDNTYFEKEFNEFKEWYKNMLLNNWEVYNIEQRMSLELDDTIIVGKPDCIFKRDDEYLIVDWKRNKENYTTLKNTKYCKKAVEPFSFLPDNKYGEIACQLHFYKKMLKRTLKEKNTTIKLSIVCFHPVHENVIETTVE